MTIKTKTEYERMISGGYVTQHAGRYILVKRDDNEWKAETVHFEAPFYVRQPPYLRLYDYRPTRKDAVAAVVRLIDAGY